LILLARQLNKLRQPAVVRRGVHPPVAQREPSRPD
jgi:hypothetical protein